LEQPRPPGLPILNGREIIHLALLLSFPAIALDEFLRTPVAQFAAQPALQLQHWVTESLMTIPLFVVGIWAGDRIAGRAGLGAADRSAIFKRALLIAASAAVALMPLWYERNKTDGLVQALVCVCLIPAAGWGVHGIASRLKRGLAARRTARRATRRVQGLGGALLVVVLAAAAGPALAWLLHNAAEPAYASQVNYTSALLAAPVHSHAFFGGHGPHTTTGATGATGGPVTAAPFAFAHQIAHAFQDGLVGQAAGLPAVVTALMWHARGQKSTKSTTVQKSAAALNPQAQAEA
jgi:hypothetical protein